MDITWYDLTYEGVYCGGVNWTVKPYVFIFYYDRIWWKFIPQRPISQTADTDHIRCAILQFLEVINGSKR